MPSPMSNGHHQAAPAGGSESAALTAVAAELATTNELLRRLLTLQRSDLVHLCVTDREPAQLIMANFPVPGAKRLIVRRSGMGGTFAAGANTPLLLVAANENRLGGELVNSGSNPITLFLSVDLLEPGTATPLAGGAAQMTIVAGASWDFRLGTILWCGNVVGLSTSGTTVTVAEV